MRPQNVFRKKTCTKNRLQVKMKNNFPIASIAVSLCLAVLSSCSNTDAPDTPDASSGIPIAFSALTHWDEPSASQDKASASQDKATGSQAKEATDQARQATTRLAATADATSFSAGDAFGLFAYHNASATPDFMNNQRVTFDGTSWTYSPTKYWPRTDGDRLSFYAYYPWRESVDGDTVKASSSTDNRLTIDYCCPNANIDLMASDKEENQTLTTNKGQVPLSFQHLLARVRFTFTYEGADEYHPVVHVLKFTVPRYKATVTCYTDEQSGASGTAYTSGLFPYTWSAATSSDEPTEIVRYVNDVAGVVIAKKDQRIDEFTVYLLPCEFPYSGNAAAPIGNFVISLNNVLHTCTPDKQISVEPGKSYTVNFKVTADYGGTGNFFITSYSIWADGGTINGTLE